MSKNAVRMIIIGIALLLLSVPAYKVYLYFRGYDDAIIEYKFPFCAPSSGAFDAEEITGDDRNCHLYTTELECTEAKNGGDCFWAEIKN